MNWLSNIITAFSSWLTSRGEIKKIRYKEKLQKKKEKEYAKTQYDRLFYQQDFDTVKIFQAFFNNENNWIEINDNIDNISFEDENGLDIKIDYHGVKYTLFQTQRKNIHHKNAFPELKDYFRLTPIIYPDFKRNFKKKQKNLLS